MTQVASPPPRPLLLWDADCAFCRGWVGRWREITGDRVEYEPYQSAAARHPEIPIEALRRSIHLVEPDGRVTSGALAVFRALRLGGSRGVALKVYESVPGAAPVAEAVYSMVARHRPIFSRLTRLLWGPHVERPSWLVARCLFTRGLGLVYAIAFASLWVQVAGLIGSRGILPAQAFLDAARAQMGPERYAYFPTLFWLGASDGALSFACGAGVVAGALAAGGLLPGPLLAIAWALYLSLTVVCRTFLGFQWDALLLEAGFLAIFAAPWRLRCRVPCEAQPPSAALFLVRWLLFRLMFLSGVVKLTSGDPSWWDLTALTYHYETQPIPSWTAWYMHHLPLVQQKGSVLLMFFSELVVPFLAFAPRIPRLFAAGLLVLLQGVFIATGNFAYFNWLTIVLCLPLVDDASWPRRLAARALDARARLHGRARAWWRSRAAWAGAMAIFVLTIAAAGDRVPLPVAVPSFLETAHDAVRPFRIVNAYGLFAVMTKTRPEIIVEGSDDGRTWLPYEFKWKPGDLARRPPFVAPHQPRLDWQMWFAALGDYRRNPWFTELLGRLLEGSPEVIGLLEKNPFPSSPPRRIRAVVYDYHFTTPEERRATGNWWKREARGLYCPPMSRLPD